MSVIQRLARIFGQGQTESKAFTLTSPEAYSLFAGLPVRSGVTVNSATALRVPAVAAAVGFISESCGNLPFKLYDRDTREAQKHHPGYELIHGEANPWTSAEELREHLTRDALLCGHGFAQVVRNGTGQPLELHRIDPAAVSVETDEYGEPSYRIRLKAGGDTILPYTMCCTSRRWTAFPRSPMPKRLSALPSRRNSTLRTGIAVPGVRAAIYPRLKSSGPKRR